MIDLHIFNLRFLYLLESKVIKSTIMHRAIWNWLCIVCSFNLNTNLKYVVRVNPNQNTKAFIWKNHPPGTYTIPCIYLENNSTIHSPKISVGTVSLIQTRRQLQNNNNQNGSVGKFLKQNYGRSKQAFICLQVFHGSIRAQVLRHNEINIRNTLHHTTPQ